MSQYGAKEVMDYTIAEYSPNLLERKPILSVDYAQMTGITVNGERLDLNGGRGNARLMSFDHSKTVEVTFTLPLIDLKMLSIISGDEITEKVANIFRREVVCPVEDKNTGEVYIELKRKPVEKSVYLYQLLRSRDMGLQAKEVGTPPVGNLEYKEMYVDGDNRKIILDKVAFPVGEEVVVFYTSNTGGKAESLRIDPTKFPKAVSIFGDMLWREDFEEQDEIHHMTIHKARFRPEYTLNMSGTDVAVLELTADVFAFREKCQNKSTYIEYVKDDSNYDFVIADMTDYNNALELVPYSDKHLYTPESWNVYQSVLRANEVGQFDTQAQVDIATANIEKAQECLEEA